MTTTWGDTKAAWLLYSEQRNAVVGLLKPFPRRPSLTLSASSNGRLMVTDRDGNIVAKTDELLLLGQTPEDSFGASRFFRALRPEYVSESEEEEEAMEAAMEEVAESGSDSDMSSSDSEEEEEEVEVEAEEAAMDAEFEPDSDSESEEEEDAEAEPGSHMASSDSEEEEAATEVKAEPDSSDSDIEDYEAENKVNGVGEPRIPPPRERRNSRYPPLEALLALPTLATDGGCKHMLAVWADRLEVIRVSIHDDRQCLQVHLVGAALDVSVGGGKRGEAVVALLCSRETPLALFTSPATQVGYP